MPNRILREGILDSDRIDKLSWAAEVFYRRLHSIVDDYGCFDGRGSILKSKLYPTERKQAMVSLPDIEKWKQETVEAGLVRCYDVAGKPYLLVLDFNQQVRIKKRKFPEPQEHAPHLQTNDSRCMPETKPNQTEEETNPNQTKQHGAFSIPSKMPPSQDLIGKMFEESGLTYQEGIDFFIWVNGKTGWEKINDWIDYTTSVIRRKLRERKPGDKFVSVAPRNLKHG